MLEMLIEISYNIDQSELTFSTIPSAIVGKKTSTLMHAV